MYTLTTLSDVEQFWHRLWEVCLFTPLGGSSAVSGQVKHYLAWVLAPCFVTSTANIVQYLEKAQTSTFSLFIIRIIRMLIPKDL